MALYINDKETGSKKLIAGHAAVDNKLNEKSNNAISNKAVTESVLRKDEKNLMNGSGQELIRYINKETNDIDLVLSNYEISFGEQSYEDGKVTGSENLSLINKDGILLNKIDENGNSIYTIKMDTDEGISINDTENAIKIFPGAILLEGDSTDISTKEGISLKSLHSAIENLKKSVSDGKERVAIAITDKGVATEITDPFNVMAENIKKIPTGTSNTQVPKSTIKSNIIISKITHKEEL